MASMHTTHARADRLMAGLDGEEMRAFNRMCARLRKAGYSRRKRAWQARALQFVYSLRFVTWYNALDPMSELAAAMHKDASIHAGRIAKIEQEATPKDEPPVVRKPRRRERPDPLA